MRRTVPVGMIVMMLASAASAQPSTTGKEANAAGAQTLPVKRSDCDAGPGRKRNGRASGRMGVPIVTGNPDIRVDGVGQVITAYCP